MPLCPAIAVIYGAMGISIFFNLRNPFSSKDIFLVSFYYSQLNFDKDSSRIF